MPSPVSARFGRGRGMPTTASLTRTRLNRRDVLLSCTSTPSMQTSAWRNHLKRTHSHSVSHTHVRQGLHNQNLTQCGRVIGVEAWEDHYGVTSWEDGAWRGEGRYHRTPGLYPRSIPPPVAGHLTGPGALVPGRVPATYRPAAKAIPGYRNQTHRLAFPGLEIVGDPPSFLFTNEGSM